MERRTLLTAVAGMLVVSAGCTSLGSDGDRDEDESVSENGDEDEDESTSENGDDAELSESELLEQFQATLEDRGFEQVDIAPVDDGLELGYDASGTSDDNVATEIELITDGYTTTIESGSSTAYLEATAYDPEDGEVLDYFTIETEWVEAYLSEDLEWPELLSRIAETFVSTEPVDDAEDGDDGGDEGGSEDGDDGDDQDGDDGDEQEVDEDGSEDESNESDEDTDEDDE
ncbi:hypothetical protein [Natronorubrum sp. A-ect3]|uniref:hypothetical protein n=1 Tax=Natronorubrum sp. A-ect3 TaxID=3242698 RepID=UPI00359F0E69